jgi:hypothetical protein
VKKEYIMFGLGKKKKPVQRFTFETPICGNDYERVWSFMEQHAESVLGVTLTPVERVRLQKKYMDMRFK